MALLEFYGTECPHCEKMRPSVEKMEQEAGVRVTRYEVWHDPDNRDLFKQVDQNFCGGVPFFFNEESKEWICGETSYETFKAWAMGKAVVH